MSFIEFINKLLKGAHQKSNEFISGKSENNDKNAVDIRINQITDENLVISDDSRIYCKTNEIDTITTDDIDNNSEIHLSKTSTLKPSNNDPVNNVCLPDFHRKVYCDNGELRYKILYSWPEESGLYVHELYLLFMAYKGTFTFENTVFSNQKYVLSQKELFKHLLKQGYIHRCTIEDFPDCLKYKDLIQIRKEYQLPSKSKKKKDLKEAVIQYLSEEKRNKVIDKYGKYYFPTSLGIDALTRSKLLIDGELSYRNLELLEESFIGSGDNYIIPEACVPMVKINEETDNGIIELITDHQKSSYKYTYDGATRNLASDGGGIHIQNMIDLVVNGATVFLNRCPESIYISEQFGKFLLRFYDSNKRVFTCVRARLN